MDEKKLFGGKWLSIGTLQGSLLVEAVNIHHVAVPTPQEYRDGDTIRLARAGHVDMVLKDGSVHQVDDPDIVNVVLTAPPLIEPQPPRVQQPTKQWLP